MIRQPGVGNRAGLAAKLGVSRARITQGMAVLGAPRPVLDAIRRVEAGGRTVTESAWRRVSRMSEVEAIRMLEAPLAGEGNRPLAVPFADAVRTICFAPTAETLVQMQVFQGGV